MRWSASTGSAGKEHIAVRRTSQTDLIYLEPVGWCTLFGKWEKWQILLAPKHNFKKTR
jgi:hypothetical protein